MENKLSDAQGQYFFWESVNNDIPKIGFSQSKKERVNNHPNTTKNSNISPL
jgi:hypothetical protein